MQIYNSMTRKKEPFVPLHEGKVGIYACGPTVYNFTSATRAPSSSLTCCAATWNTGATK